ncbi:TonB-dependent receptor domain-containing protein [Sphingopyxis solisilvae]|uniref:TonB-dependent receptor domain-containing protein n=1 Tax=Sphingopyxis solisilvae TaxID=1886788 RepID=UPI0018929068|nr:TonB-dependent receptor [Sphingopyxis solisilvae]
MKKTRLLVRGSALTVALFSAMPAVAQTETVAADEESATEAAASGTIVVTGSRIRRPNLVSTVPITSITGDSVFQGGEVNIAETLNDLPQLRSTFAQQNPGLGIGIAGLNLLDLRGLGTQRTLVLVNGRRHVPADILNNAVSPDVNTIPNDLIERVDIVTGGNSAIYGSDAIAGVVNFVLRRDYQGVQLRAQAGITEEGFGGNQYVSGMVGKNFADGRGNITLHGEYSRSDRIFGSDVPWFRSNDGLLVVDVDPAGLPNNSDGFPDRSFFRDIRSASIHVHGLVPITQRVGAGQCGTGIGSTNGAPTPTGNPYNCTYIFTPEGRLVPQTGTRVGQGIIGGIVGGNGQTGREGKLLSVQPFLERYNFNLLSRYEFSAAAEVFVEAKWNRVNALGNNAGPSFNQGTRGTGDFRERVRLDNPFLNPADRATLTNLILASNCNTDLQVSCPAQTNIGTADAPVFIVGNLTDAQRAQVIAGTYRFVNARSLSDVGLRDERFQRDTYRIVAGLRGSFWDDWNYEISVNYGKFRENITTNGFIDRQRFSLAMDAGRNPVTGQIQCRSQFDPAAALPSQRGETGSLAARNLARLAADIAACVPYNPFGAPDNSASVNYFARTFTASSGLEQLIFSGFVGGDTSGFLTLPGGPVSFALGAEYRREKAFYEQDPFVTDGFTNGVSIPSFRPDPFEVKELFGEARIPLLRDAPFAEELTVSGAARVADYGSGAGTVWSYNAGLDWAPLRDIRFRGNYGRAVRAPNVSETAFPLVPNFAPGFIDPCSPGGLAQGSATRAANCLADLGPALLAGLPSRAYSLPVISGSNTALQAEKSDSWTVGAVIQPRFLPGFSLSIDWYDITVKNVIVQPTAQVIANSCYDSATLDNQFCRQFTRWRGPGLGPGAGASPENPGEILNNSLVQQPLNFASRKREGIDANMNYRITLDDKTTLNTNLIYTHNLKISNFQDPADPRFENRLLGEVGDPKDEFRLDVDLSHGPFTLGYRMRYIGGAYISTYEDQNSLNGLPPANADFADILRVPAVSYHDLRFEWNLSTGRGPSDDLKFYFGVDNLFDKLPPLGSTATGLGPGGVGTAAIYDFRGRSYYAGVRARF